MPDWNLFNWIGHLVGVVDGDTKENVERVAREQLGLRVDADLCRKGCVKVPGGDRNGRTLKGEESIRPNG